MIDQTTPKGKIVSALMRLAAEKKWRDIAMLDIAAAAGITLVELRKEFDSKRQMLSSFGYMIDADVLAKATPRQLNQTARDAIFDVVMSRFDALAPYKSAMKSAHDGGALDASLLKSLLRSQTVMLQAAGIDTESPGGKVRVAGLAAVFTRTFQVWLDDTDPGMARTMAALDRYLRSGERSLEMLDGLCATANRVRDIFRPGGRSSPTPPSAPVTEPHAHPPV